MIRKTKVAIAAASLSIVGAGVAIAVPVALTTSNNGNTTSKASTVSPAAPVSPANDTAASTSPSNVSSSTSEAQLSQSPSVQASRVDAAAQVLKGITSSGLSKDAFNRLVIDSPEGFDANKLGLTLSEAFKGVQIQVSKLPLFDKQSVRYVISEGSYAVQLRVTFNRFSGDNEALLAVLSAAKSTGFTSDAFSALSFNSEPFDAFKLKIAVPSALDSADLLVSKVAGTSEVTFKSAMTGKQIVSTFASFASEDASTRVAQAKQAIETLTTSDLTLYMLGQAFASNQSFSGSIIGTQTPAAVQAVNVTFSKAYGKTYFTYSINEAGASSVTGSVWIKDFSPDTYRELNLVNYLVKQFKSVSSSNLTIAEFTALDLPEGTPWNAATLGVSFAESMEMNGTVLPGSPAANFSQPKSVSSWQDFPFRPRVTVSKAVGAKKVDVKFTLGTAAVDQYSFSTQLSIDFKTFGDSAVTDRIDQLAAALAKVTVSSSTATNFKNLNVATDLPLASAWLGFNIFNDTPVSNIASPWAVNGVKVAVTKPAGSTQVSYTLSSAGQSKSLSVNFEKFAPDGEEVSLGKAVSSLQAVKATSTGKQAFAKRQITKQALDASGLGFVKPASLEGYSVLIEKAADSLVVNYTVMKDGYSESFSVTFDSFGPDAPLSLLPTAERLQAANLSLSEIKTVGMSSKDFKALELAPTPLAQAAPKLGISVPIQVLSSTKTVVTKKAGSNDLLFNVESDGSLTTVVVTIQRFDANPNNALASAEQAIAAITTTSLTKKAFLDLKFNNEWDFKAPALAQALGTTAVLSILDTNIRIKKAAGSASVTYTFNYAGFFVTKDVTFTNFNPANITDADQALLTSLSSISTTALGYVSFSLLEVAAGTPHSAIQVGFDLPAIAQGRDITVFKQRDGKERLGSFWMQLTVNDIPGKPVVNLTFWSFSSRTAVAPVTLNTSAQFAAIQLSALLATTVSQPTFEKNAFNNVPFDSKLLAIEGKYAVPTGMTIYMTKQVNSKVVTYVITDASGATITTSVTFVLFPEEGPERWYVQHSFMDIYQTSLTGSEFHAASIPAGTTLVDAFGKLGLKIPSSYDSSRFTVTVSKQSRSMWVDFVITPIWKGHTQGAFESLAWIALDNGTL